jgi:hypothetical protein
MALLKQFSIYRVVAIGLFSLPIMLYAQARNKKNKGPYNSGVSVQYDSRGGVGLSYDPSKRSNGVGASKGVKYAKGKDTVDYHLEGSPLPPIRAVSLTGEQYTDASLKNNANLFVMMFNPGCEHCEDMTLALIKNIDLFKQSNIVMIAAPMQGPYMPPFINGLRTNKYPTLKIGLDSANFIDRTFNYIALPQINIYGPDRRLIKSFAGITTIDSLKRYIQ